MKILLTTIFILTLSQAFGQAGQLIIGKVYKAGRDSTSTKVYVSIQNDLDFVIRDIVLTYDKQRILTVKRIKSDERKCYSFPKKELRGDNLLILLYGAMTDTLTHTDEVSYNIHELEISSIQKPLTEKQRIKLQALEKESSRKEDRLFVEQRRCNHRQLKL
jgi:hypothetical protein